MPSFPGYRIGGTQNNDVVIQIFITIGTTEAGAFAFYSLSWRLKLFMNEIMQVEWNNHPSTELIVMEIIVLKIVDLLRN